MNPTSEPHIDDSIERVVATPDTEVELFSLAGRDGHLRQVNEAFSRLIGREHSDVEGRSLLELVHPDDIPEIVAALAALEAGSREVLLENRFFATDGTAVHLQWVARPVEGSDLWWAAGRDVTQFRTAIAQSVDLQTRLDLAIGGLGACAWELDVRNDTFIWDDQAVHVLDPQPTQSITTVDDLASLTHPDDRQLLTTAIEQLKASVGPMTAEFRIGDDPHAKHVSMRGQVTAHDHRQRPVRAIGILIDVTNEKALEEHMMRLVMSDALTGIANRRAFDQQLRNELKRSKRNESAMSVLMIDIDDFKRFNDTFGHLVGDDALCTIARTLQRNLPRTGDLIARFGGEEFSVLLPDTALDAAGHVADRLLDSVRNATVRQAPGWQLTVSIGISSTHEHDSDTALELLSRADSALYIAKDSGKDRRHSN
ncbi:MAG: diguanylate cyclase [Ilumatobacter sp.]|uniref:GGDEF domain-containing protein n=1 Tax=Ilumatobacter sp. TaxID=1967498 RepID=UPI003C730D72